jgi:MFS family permease
VYYAPELLRYFAAESLVYYGAEYPSTFGYINSFVGVGAVIGTIFLASRKPGSHLKQILFFSTVLMGIGLICFSQFNNFPAAMFFAAVAGYGSIAQFTISNIIVQSDAAPEMRGRTIGVLLMAIFGMMPLGSVIIGAATEHIGAPTTVLIQGILAVVIALLFAKFLIGPAKKSIPENEAIDITLK